MPVNSFMLDPDSFVFKPLTLYRATDIKKVIFNDPATIILWDDGTKTVVKCQDGDIYDKEIGMAMAICKKFFGNKANFNNHFKEWVYSEE